MGKLSGIYEIRNGLDGKRYIGSATYLRSRWRSHKALLNKGNHHSRYLQNSWNMHGSENFQFNLLLICDTHNLVMYEQRLLDAFKPEYNGRSIANSPLGTKHSAETRAKMSATRIGKRHSIESRMKISEAHEGKKLSAIHCMNIAAKMMGNKYRLGYPQSAESRLKISMAKKGKKAITSIVSSGGL